jgi:hypothetical protein
MVRAYIYLISFKNTNDIYIGKTIHNVYKRLKSHQSYFSDSVRSYVRDKFDNDWSNVYIDVIDSVDMSEDLTHLINHPSNIVIYPDYNYKIYTRKYKTNEDLLNHKLAYTEYFHIHNYKNDGKYNLINKSIVNGYDVYDIYKFLNYTKK